MNRKTPRRSARRTMRGKMEVKYMNIKIISGIAIIVVGALAFFGGMQYQKSTKPTNQMMFAQGQGRAGQTQNGRFGGNRGGQAVMGEVVSSDDTSLTVKLQDGSSKIVILSDKTSINKQATGSKADLKNGEKVAVFGSTNTDGSVTAQSIQLNPMLQMGKAKALPSPTTTQ